MVRLLVASVRHCGKYTVSDWVLVAKLECTGNLKERGVSRFDLCVIHASMHLFKYLYSVA